jgi:putative PIN family toxin of toxin-antitoxin system
MRLAVLDTNVMVSAGIKPSGIPAKIVMDWVLEGQVQLVTSPAVVTEYREVVRREKFQKYGFPPLWLEFAIEESLLLPEPALWPYACPDPKDAPFLASAHASGAWLVTGNLRHFPESALGGVRVISPADYLAHLAGAAGRPVAEAAELE